MTDQRGSLMQATDDVCVVCHNVSGLVPEHHASYAHGGYVICDECAEAYELRTGRIIS